MKKYNSQCASWQGRQLGRCIKMFKPSAKNLNRSIWVPVKERRRSWQKMRVIDNWSQIMGGSSSWIQIRLASDPSRRHWNLQTTQILFLNNYSAVYTEISQALLQDKCLKFIFHKWGSQNSKIQINDGCAHVWQCPETDINHQHCTIGHGLWLWET